MEIPNKERFNIVRPFPHQNLNLTLAITYLELEKRFRLHDSILLAIYPMLMMVLLAMLGGESESGLSVTSPLLWIIWGAVLWMGWRDYKKDKEQDGQATE